MKIIDKGKLPAERIWRGRCHNCKTLAEATEAELDKITYDQRSDGPFGEAPCPLCKQRMIFYPVKE